MITQETLSDWLWTKIGEVPHLQTMLRAFDGVYLAGGLLRTILNNEPFDQEHTDVDLFFETSAHLEHLKSFMDASSDFKKVYQCPENKLATYVYLDGSGEATWKFQLISVDFYPDVQCLLDSFDFTCIMVGTDGENLYADERFTEDSSNKALVWNKITYPAASLRRLMKYACKGYTMREEQYQWFVKMCWEHNWEIKDEALVYVD